MTSEEQVDHVGPPDHYCEKHDYWYYFACMKCINPWYESMCNQAEAKRKGDDNPA